MAEQIVGNWRLFEQIGTGKFGVVYRAEHRFLGRPAAVKLLRPERTTDEREVMRFINEARYALAIEHANVVKVYDAGRLADGTVYLAMELVHGESLAQRLEKQSRLPEDQALAIAADIADGLHAAHARGVVHRDVKPANVILIEEGGGVRAKVVDFGVAKLAPHLRPPGGGVATGGIPGSPAYMSPEQSIGAANVDGRSDLYSLGCVLFEMIGGRLPFPHHDLLAMLEAHRSTPAPSLRSLAPEVSPAAEAVTAKLLAKDRRDRYQTGREVVKILAPDRPEAPLQEPARAAWSRWAIAAVVAASALVVLGVTFLIWGLNALQTDQFDRVSALVRWQNTTGEQLQGPDTCADARRRMGDPGAPYPLTLAEIDYACRRGFAHARMANWGTISLTTGSAILALAGLRSWLRRRRASRAKSASAAEPVGKAEPAGAERAGERAKQVVDSTLPRPPGPGQPPPAA